LLPVLVKNVWIEVSGTSDQCLSPVSEAYYDQEYFYCTIHGFVRISRAFRFDGTILQTTGLGKVL